MPSPALRGDAGSSSQKAGTCARNAPPQPACCVDNSAKAGASREVRACGALCAARQLSRRPRPVQAGSGQAAVRRGPMCHIGLSPGAARFVSARGERAGRRTWSPGISRRSQPAADTVTRRSRPPEEPSRAAASASAVATSSSASARPRPSLAPGGPPPEWQGRVGSGPAARSRRPTGGLQSAAGRRLSPHCYARAIRQRACPKRKPRAKCGVQPGPARGSWRYRRSPSASSNKGCLRG